MKNPGCIPCLTNGLAIALVGSMINYAAPVQSQSAPAAILVGNAAATAGSWGPTGNLNAGRFNHTATLLPNGKVLVVGGRTAFSPSLRSAELYDPISGTWRDTSPLAVPRSAHTATLLPSGQVLVAGGWSGPAPGPSYGYLKTAELYDPVTETWTSTGDLHGYRFTHKATLLQNGKVLVAGDLFSDNRTCELYDPATGSWSATGALNDARGDHAQTLLLNGNVLVAGGSIDVSLDDYVSISSAEVYDVVTGTWKRAGDLQIPITSAPLILLPNGEAMVAGGATNGSVTNLGVPTQLTDLYDPVSQNWRAGASMMAPRSNHSATRLPDGRVLIVGGSDADHSTESYDPTAGTWTNAGDISISRSGHTATLLQNGNVLIAGGRKDSWAELQSAELYATYLVPEANSFRITSLFSDQAGLYQIIQFTELSGLNDQQHFAGLTLVSISRSGVTKRFIFPTDLSDSNTAYRRVLIKTASLSLPSGYFDFVVPDGFLPTEAGGSVGIQWPGLPEGDYFTATYVGAVPFDGHSAFRTDGGIDPFGLFQSFNSPVFHVTASVDPVIEYYNQTRDHYFVTASQPDIDALDSGRIAGFTRTGYTFPAWISTYVDPVGAAGTGPPPGLQPVCRYYIPPVDGDSHFFSVSATECSVAKTKFPEYVLETTSSFLATLPNPQTGACPVDQVPVYRLWNGRSDSNHRYTASTVIRDQMVAKGYVAEGSGPNAVAMCVGGHN